MPLGQFTEEAYAGLSAGREQIAIGLAKIAYESLEIKRQDAFHSLIGRPREEVYVSNEKEENVLVYSTVTEYGRPASKVGNSCVT